MKNRILDLLNIELPIIQAGMIWCSGWELASAVSNAGGLGLIGSGSMYPNELEDNIIKCKRATTKPFGVNLPLFYPDLQSHVDIIIKEKVPVVFTSAGNPAQLTQIFQKAGIVVVHVIASKKFALKAQAAGVNAIVAEGFEAGGHNGKDETTTLVLLQDLFPEIIIPVIAAGGIGSGRAILAALALGADAVQIGSRFVCAEESSAHENFKLAILKSGEGDTKLMLKTLMPVRLLKNPFFEKVQQAELAGATMEELQNLLGKARAKKGMFEGNLEEGELEIGQIASTIREIKPAKAIIAELLNDYQESKRKLLDKIT